MKTAHQRIQKISKVMKRAVEKAAEKHRLMGVPMVIWKDEKVVEFLPEPARAPRPRKEKSEGSGINCSKSKGSGINF
jgi:hypothetical protein